jgi:glycosyltransferase involved in cell wall biosynthesis
MTRQALSVLIVARNEEAALPGCLASAAFADEIVVVLDRSGDRSAAIARSAGARVIEGAWPIEADRRNQGIAACAGPWILELDADERVSEALCADLSSLLIAPTADYYLIPFHNFIGEVWVRHGWGAYNGTAAKRSLFRKGHKVWGAGEMHPRITLTGTGGSLSGHIDHYVDRDTTALFARLDRYAGAAARDAIRNGDTPRLARTIRRLFSRFLKSYWSRKGYREGWRGVALALFSALYPALTHLKFLELRAAAALAHEPAHEINAHEDDHS